jgi:copper chaperone
LAARPPASPPRFAAAYRLEREMIESRLTVPEMSCDGCRTTIEGALVGLPGVATVSVDLDRKLVSVEHDEHELSIDQLAEAVTEQGYEVTERQAQG